MFSDAPMEYGLSLFDFCNSVSLSSLLSLSRSRSLLFSSSTYYFLFCPMFLSHFYFSHSIQFSSFSRIIHFLYHFHFFIIDLDPEFYLDPIFDLEFDLGDDLNSEFDIDLINDLDLGNLI